MFNGSPHFWAFGSFRIRRVVYSSRHSSYSNCHPLSVVFCNSYYVLGSSSATSLSENVENLPLSSPSVPKQLSYHAFCCPFFLLSMICKIDVDCTAPISLFFFFFFFITLNSPSNLLCHLPFTKNVASFL